MRPDNVTCRTGLDVYRQTLAAQIRELARPGPIVEVPPSRRLDMHGRRAETRLDLLHQFGAVFVAVDHDQPGKPHSVC